ncbi:MAG: hypothetical protein H6707_17520 [Deltaproteobacteria bacterium]|nr:hypothetical protein [Deltaproteobacteria bacterium]
MNRFLTTALRALSLAVLVALTLASVTIAIYGWDYYTSDLLARRDHPLHRLLAPYKAIGLAGGFVALALFFFNLGYLLRKTFRWRALGSMRAWLNFHVVSGLLASAITAIHAAFSLRSEVTTICIYAMLVALFTGIVGRYFISWIPRNRHGDRIALADLQDQLLEFADAVRPQIIHSPAAIGALQTIVDVADPSKLAARRKKGFWAATAQLREIRDQLEQLGRTLGPDNRHWHQTRRLTLRRCRQAVLWSWTTRLMDAWRTLHRVSALVFLGTVLIHVVWGVRFLFA